MINALYSHRQIILSIAFVTLLIGGWFYPPFGYFMVFCMFATMALGVIKGRKWCDWYCPRGSFYDAVLRRFSRNVAVPTLFRHPLFRAGWLALLMYMVVSKLIPVWGDFYLMGKPFVLILTVTTGVGLLFGAIYQYRIWCMFCPMGTMANLLGRGKQQIAIDEGSCIDCETCAEVCRMQIKPYGYKEAGSVSHGDCLKCQQCVENCPTGALTDFLSWTEDSESKERINSA